MDYADETLFLLARFAENCEFNAGNFAKSFVGRRGPSAQMGKAWFQNACIALVLRPEQFH